jgi:Bacterial Ig-like domain (group 3)
MKNLLWAGGLAIVISTVGVAVPAFAAGGTATTTTVEALKPSISSGQPEVFRATVAPTKVGMTKITGSITWTVTGQDGTVIPCTVATNMASNGKSECKMAKATLLSGDSPYTVTAAYSGDTNFANSSNTITQNVSVGSTKVRIVIAVKPTSGASTTVMAYVKGGAGTSAISGSVTFAAAASPKGVAPYCEGSATPITANDTQPIINGFATCTLPAGWFVVPSPSNANPRPKTTWSVSASYSGNGSFTSSTSNRKGRSSH